MIEVTRLVDITAIGFCTGMIVTFAPDGPWWLWYTTGIVLGAAATSYALFGAIGQHIKTNVGLIESNEALIDACKSFEETLNVRGRH